MTKRWSITAWLERARRKAAPAVASHEVVAHTPKLDAWQQLGADPEEREHAINRLFDARIGTIEFDSMWDFDYSHTDSSGSTETAYSSMSFCIARDLASMDLRESEFLRATYLLYNANLIDLQTWRELTFCFVYGEGKAVIVSCDYREPIELPFRDWQGAIEYFANCHQATVESAAGKLRAIIECHAQKPNMPTALDLTLAVDCDSPAPHQVPVAAPAPSITRHPDHKDRA